MAKNQLNSKIESLIFSSNPNKIYKKIKKGAILEEDFEDVQTINDFINDKERNKRTKLRNNIDVYYIGALPQEFQTISEKLLNLISIQFSVNIRIQGELMVEKIYRKNQYKIYNLTKDIYYCINSQKNKIKKEERLQIYKENSNLIVELNSGEILDMLINFRNKSTLMILGLTAYNIFNPDIPDDTIMGFSSGDGASIVSLTECYDNKLKDVVIRNKNAFFEMVKTSLHELCHTIGIDHCVDYHCINHIKIRYIFVLYVYVNFM